jgi:hypothetical protein
VYTLKPGSVKIPDTYLGADIHVHELSNGEKAWAISSNTYVKRAVTEVERELNRVGLIRLLNWTNVARVILRV